MRPLTSPPSEAGGCKADVHRGFFGIEAHEFLRFSFAELMQASSKIHWLR